MIFPYPVDLKEPQRFPLTATLIALNIFFFVLIFSGSDSSISSSAFLGEANLQLSGRLYSQYLQKLPAAEFKSKPLWVRSLNLTKAESLSLLGGYALRDSIFLGKAGDILFSGDDVQIDHWKTALQEFRKQYKDQALYRFGLVASEKGGLGWITYQFAHSNWLHLLSNLVFLILIGVAVESLIGSAQLVLLYILGGLAGGLGFVLVDPSGTVPMVGASASVTALLAFYTLAETKTRIRYFYFISPMIAHNGFIYLPTLLLIPLFLVSDLASLWSSPEGLNSGVAYAAHLGGAAFGLILGAIYRVKNMSLSRTSFQSPL